MKYFSMKNLCEMSVDISTSGLDALSDAYSSLMQRCESGAFPGSKAWLASKRYSDQATEILNARPELLAYRANQAQAARAARLAGLDVLWL